MQSGRMILQIPADLVYDKRIQPAGKALYMTLVQFGPCSMNELAAVSQMNRQTVRRLVSTLAVAGWVTVKGSRSRRAILATRPEVTQRNLANHLREIRPVMSPVGESLFKLILDLEVADDRYVNNARVPFLPNSETGEYLELDRWYYERRVGGEYEGSPHQMVTAITNEDRLKVIQAHDAMKIELCRAKGIPLIIVGEDDLSLEGVAKKIPPELPRAYYDPNDLYSRTLNQLCEEYVATCVRARMREAREKAKRQEEEERGR